MRASTTVAILGGTGDLGEGLALRLCGGRRVIIGSRDPARAAARAAEYAERAGCRDVEGSSNADAAARADYVVLATPASALPALLDEVAGRLREGSLVISPVVPMSRRGDLFVHDPSQLGAGSAAEYAASRLGNRVAAAFHTVPAGLLSDVGRRLDLDVLVASDREAFESMRRDLRIEGVRYLHAGPLEMARYLEQLVPLLLNVGRRNGIRDPTLRVIRGARSLGRADLDSAPSALRPVLPLPRPGGRERRGGPHVLRALLRAAPAVPSDLPGRAGREGGVHGGPHGAAGGRRALLAGYLVRLHKGPGEGHEA